MKSLAETYAQFAAFDLEHATDTAMSYTVHERKNKYADSISYAAGWQAEASRRSAVDLAVGKLIAACEVDSYTQNVISANAVREALAQLRLALEGG